MHYWTKSDECPQVIIVTKSNRYPSPRYLLTFLTVILATNSRLESPSCWVTETMTHPADIHLPELRAVAVETSTGFDIEFTDYLLQSCMISKSILRPELRGSFSFSAAQTKTRFSFKYLQANN